MRSSAIAFLLTFLTFTSSPYKDSSINIVEVFKLNKIEFKQAYISGWAKLQETFDDNEDLESIVRIVSDKMEVVFNESEISVDGFVKKRIYKGNYEGGSISLEIKSIYNSTLKINEHVIIIDITQNENLWSITGIGDRVTKCLGELGYGSPANISIEGYVEGNINSLQKEKLISNMLDSIDADRVESIKTYNLLSVSGYTEKIAQFIKSKGRRVNINIASRYSPLENKTYFWIGTPLINIEY